ncbi:MAG: hypothetical protein MJ191_00685 [Clostridium sp.]|nr:hypothetical protein [Clostridium sp.]
MKFTKRLVVGLVSSGIIATFFTGCTTKDIEAVRTENAEEVINLFNEYNKANDIENMVSLYSDVYLDSVGYSRGKVVEMLEANRKNAEITKSESESIEVIDENIKKAVVNMGIIEDGEEVQYTYTYAMIKEDDGWALSPDGVMECSNFEVPEIVSGKLNLYLSKMIKLVDGYILRADILNSSSKVYSFGKKDNLCKIIVETTEGEYSTSMLEEIKLDKKVKTYFMAKFDDLDGEVKKVTITNVYDVEDRIIKEDYIRNKIKNEK